MYVLTTPCRQALSQNEGAATVARELVQIREKLELLRVEWEVLFSLGFFSRFFFALQPARFLSKS
jgi:hypothetical protein